MKKSMIAVALVAMFAGSAMAEGLSSSKLDKLGLSSLAVASDQQGEEVRGAGFGASFFTFTVTVTEGIVTPAGAFVNNAANTSTASFAGAYTFGQDPRAAAGDLVTGQGGIDPVAPGSPFTVNLATPNGVWTASSFGISFGQGN